MKYGGCLFAIVLICLVFFGRSQCPPHCKTCIAGSYSYKCTSCYDGYFLSNQACLSQNPSDRCDSYSDSRCNTDSYSSTGTSIGTSIGIYLGLSIGIILVLSGICTLICCFWEYIVMKCKECYTGRPQGRINPPAALPFQASNAYGNQIRVVPFQIQDIDLPDYFFQSQWKKDRTEFNQKQPCVICLEERVFLKTYCNHYFHPQCIEEWVRKKQGDCPLCKSKQMSPVKFYCRECFESYKEMGFGEVERMARENDWKTCCNLQQE